MNFFHIFFNRIFFLCGKETKIPVAQAVDGIRFDIAAAQMTEKITICTVAGNGTRYKAKSYSVREYADYVLAGNYGELTHNLVKEMLNYGGMAQRYFAYNEDNLANTGITGTAAAALPDEAKDCSVSGSANGIQLHGASLVYKDKIAVRYYFSGSVAGFTFSANGKTYNPIAKEGLYCIEIADIMPQDLHRSITLTVEDSAGRQLTVTYGPMHYIVRMGQKGNADLVNLLQALYKYNLAAKEYAVDL